MLDVRCEEGVAEEGEEGRVEESAAWGEGGGPREGREGRGDGGGVEGFGEDQVYLAGSECVRVRGRGVSWRGEVLRSSDLRYVRMGARGSSRTAASSPAAAATRQ